jgi:hypothetical protein
LQALLLAAEQRRFAAFREEAGDLRDRTGDPCPTPPEPSCATVAGFDEPRRTIVTN